MMPIEKIEQMKELVRQIDPRMIWGPDESDVRSEMQQLICSGQADTAAIAQFLLEAERQIANDPKIKELIALNQLREKVVRICGNNGNGSLGNNLGSCPVKLISKYSF